MKKFLILYTAPVSASEQMAKATPEEANAGMQAWMNWANKAGNAIVDLGAPLGNGHSIDGASVDAGRANPVGYSILEGESMEAISELLSDHPHSRVPHFSIQMFECLPTPGRAAEQTSRAA